MTQPQLLSIIESPTHPELSDVYQRLNMEHTQVSSMRKAISRVKRQPPDFIVAEFFYGFGNNYAGVNISNLDVLLYTLQRYSPETRVIVMVEKQQHQYVDKLNEIFPLFAVLQQPISNQQLETLLTKTE
ncbi:MAG TPA: hypothetical protein EYH06_02305 [Chromatiales bacterium]|nr:hypothetical protein [Thiotrichales bacterium]HIP67406.1 hypothetical protein [Chromatiales bacterium]